MWRVVGIVNSIVRVQLSQKSVSIDEVVDYSGRAPHGFGEKSVLQFVGRIALPVVVAISQPCGVRYHQRGKVLLPE